MNLTPEEKAVGRENYQAAIGSEYTRRDFLKSAACAGLVSGGGLGAFYYGYGKSVNDPVRVGVMGTGDEGCVLIGAINPEYIQVKSVADIRPYNQFRAFHGDSYSATAKKVRPGLMKKYGWDTEDQAKKEVKVYNDYREMLENAKADGLEAVIIALPLHLHAPAAIAAMQAGLHVLTEKLMGQTVHACKEMGRVAATTGLHLATGHQRHYNVLYANAVELINQGILGDLHYIRAQWHRGNMPGKDSWQQPMPKSVKPKDPQAEILEKKLASWTKKLGDAKKARWVDEQRVCDLTKLVAQCTAQIADEEIKDKVKDYGYEDRLDKGTYKRPAIEELIRWRLWERTGGGLMAELGSHQLDAAGIFITAAHRAVNPDAPKQHPLCVVAYGNRPVFPADRDCDDHVYCMFEYAAPDYNADDPNLAKKKIGVQYSTINGNGFGGYGEVVMGTKATLTIEKETDTQLFKSGSKSKVSVNKDKGLDTQESGDAVAVGKAAVQNVSRGYTEEEEHWAWCIRNPAPENKPNCYPKVALADAVIALTTNMAARKGGRIDFKDEWFDIDSDETPEGIKPDVSRYKS
jgi:predicted dehydrogenase